MELENDVALISVGKEHARTTTGHVRTISKSGVILPTRNPKQTKTEESCQFTSDTHTTHFQSENIILMKMYFDGGSRGNGRIGVQPVAGFGASLTVDITTKDNVTTPSSSST